MLVHVELYLTYKCAEPQKGNISEPTSEVWKTIFIWIYIYIQMYCNLILAHIASIQLLQTFSRPIYMHTAWIIVFIKTAFMWVSRGEVLFYLMCQQEILALTIYARFKNWLKAAWRNIIDVQCPYICVLSR